MKKIKLLALAVCAMLSTNAFAADPEYALDKTNGVRYLQDKQAGEDGSATKPYSAKVYGAPTALTSVVIPATFQTEDENGQITIFKVVGFNADWDNKTSTDAASKSVSLKASVTSISINATNMANLENAFTNMEKLEKVTITATPDDWTASPKLTSALTATVLSTIKEYDLSGWTKLTNINNGAFKVSGITNKLLTTVKLPEGLIKIGDDAFNGFKGTAITLPSTLKEIGESAFSGAAITSITLPETLTTIGKTAFTSCAALASIDIPEAVTSIGVSAFSFCEALAEVTGMEGVAALAKGTFEGCEALATISLPEATLQIGEDCFKDCIGLTSIEIAGEFTTVGNSAFSGCEKLAAIDLSGAAATFTTIDPSVFAGCEALASITLPESIATLEDDVFKDTKLTSLDLSATAVKVLNKIFGTITKEEDAYSSLTSIVLPEGLLTITKKALNYCTGLTGIELPDGLKKIDEESFAYCSGLTEITLPASLTTDIPAKAFYYCTGLKTVNYEPTVGAAKQFDTQAFLGCKPYIKINTNKYYFQTYGYDAPLNTKFFDDAALSVTTVPDAGTSGKYFAKYCPVLDVTILPADLSETGGKIFTVYEDEGAIYLTRIRVKGGKYQIPAYTHLIIKSDVEATYTFTVADAAISSSVDEDQICPVNNEEDITLEDYQTKKYLNDDFAFVGEATGTKTYIEGGYKYLYALTNKAPYGFGFTEFTGTKLKKGGFFLPSTVAPAAGGRLNVIWVDDEDEATGINSIVAKSAQNDVIYNLAGQKVSASYKGIVIKNGKKTILK